MKLSGDVKPYLVGLGRDVRTIRYYVLDRNWKGARYAAGRALGDAVSRRSWWGLWQAEWCDGENGVRGLTAAHTRRRAVRRAGRGVR